MCVLSLRRSVATLHHTFVGSRSLETTTSERMSATPATQQHWPGSFRGHSSQAPLPDVMERPQSVVACPNSGKDAPLLVQLHQCDAQPRLHRRKKADPCPAHMTPAAASVETVPIPICSGATNERSRSRAQSMFNMGSSAFMSRGRNPPSRPQSIRRDKSPAPAAARPHAVLYNTHDPEKHETSDKIMRTQRDRARVLIPGQCIVAAPAVCLIGRRGRLQSSLLFRSAASP